MESAPQEIYPVLKKIKLLRDRVEDWTSYPFSVPAISSLDELAVRSRICFFTGENGTGKSTLLEAIAVHYGFGREGGTRNFMNDGTESNHSVDALVRASRLSFEKRTGAGYFLRAESFFNTVSYMDGLDTDDGPTCSAPLSSYYGGRSLHTRSHGETFFKLLELKFQRNVLKKHKDAQFIISTHSPILLGYPKAQIVSFDDGPLHEIDYEETAPMQIVRHFVNQRESFLKELFNDPPSLFKDES